MLKVPRVQRSNNYAYNFYEEEDKFARENVVEQANDCKGTEHNQSAFGLWQKQERLA